MWYNGEIVLMGYPAEWGLCWVVSQGPRRQVGWEFLSIGDLPDLENNLGVCYRAPSSLGWGTSYRVPST